ncbi:MAG: serine/threonine protein kinase [Acidobacteria bacterium]|nr:serine/threonine protein kinase [Acidobacteriota bacterium]MBV9475129.1 serine/threonine protein kinase [Acidobacteriota bacterium]
MTTTDVFWDRVRALFHELSELPSAARASRLAQCDDAVVRDEVASLLAAHEDAGEFLERSVWELIDTREAARLAGTMIGPYRIVRPLGHGGMGAVFLAERADAQFAQRVAVKLVRGGAALVGRFRQERQILAALEHPNIARLLDGGTTADGVPYLVMEFVDGVPLDVYCRELSLTRKLQLFLQLCDAVQYAHRNLVIHRDLKPANVFVTSDGIPKLLDFGIAKLTRDEPRADATVTRMMTPDYASPEQLVGDPVTTASDVYSLGVILFELLTGGKPFGRERTAATEPARPSTVARVLRGDLDTIVLTAMEPHPARRYGSVEKLADDVRRYLGGHPIAARPATFRYRAAKFVRRNKLATAATIAIVAVIALAFAVTLQQKRMAERRFEEVRSLAHAVVFELHDAIAPLPGSTHARELLVRRALVYLDALASEAQDNTRLQLELAGAYLKIGDVQGMPYSANLGDTAGAMTSYRKARAIAEAVEPSNASRAILADVHDRIGFVEGRARHWEAALREHEASRALREQLPRDVPGSLALARTWVAIGDCLHVGGPYLPASLKLRTPDKAYNASLAILTDLPDDRAHRSARLMELGRTHQRLGGYYTTGPDGFRDMAHALEHHDAAIAVMQQRVALDPNDAVARRNLADEFVMKATAQNRFDDPEGALDNTRRALPVFAALAAADPRNQEAQHDIGFTYSEMSFALVKLGRWSEARDVALRGIAIRERLYAADPGNREDRRDAGILYALLAQAEAGAHHAAAAAAASAKSKALIAETER